MSSELLTNRTTEYPVERPNDNTQPWQHISGDYVTIPSALMRNLFDAAGIEYEVNESNRDEFSPTRLLQAVQKVAMSSQNWGEATYSYDGVNQIDEYVITASKDFTATTLTAPITEEEKFGQDVAGAKIKSFSAIPHNAVFMFQAPTANTGGGTATLTVNTNVVKYDDSVSELQSLETISITKNIVNPDGTTPIINQIPVDEYSVVSYDADNDKFILISTWWDKVKKVVQATTSIEGLSVLTQNIKLTYVSTTSISYSSGTFVVDDGSNKCYINSGTISFTGLSANTTYHIFAIYNPTTKTSVIHYDVSLSSPTLPSGFTKKKHIFSFITNSLSQLRDMTIFNLGTMCRVEYVSSVVDYASTTLSSTGTLLSITVPDGIQVQALISVNAINKSSGNVVVGFTHPNKISTADDVCDFWGGGNTGAHDQGGNSFPFTNTLAQIKGFGRSGNTVTQLTGVGIVTNGYIIFL